MNDTDLQIVVKVKDEASAEFKKIGESVKDASQEMGSKLSFLSADVTGFTKVLGGVAVAGGAALTAFLYSSVKAAAESEEAMASMDATLKSMGKSAENNRKAVLDAADAAVKLGFDDEDAALSITKLYQRTNDLSQATKLNNLAMDLARAKHIDLRTATEAVSMVLSGQGRVLTQYGISLKETADPLKALEELQKQVAGQADAFSSTFQGQMQVLSISFQNIKENIGGALLTALMPFIKQFTDWLNDPQTKQQFAYWTSEFQSWAEVIIPTVVDVFKLWIDVLNNVYEIMLKIGTAILSVVDKAQQLGNTLGSAFKNAGSNIKWAVGLEGRAVGGPVMAGVPYMVGENGPEVFMPSQSGSIIPNNKVGGMGGMTVNISGNFYGSDQQLAEKMGNTIAKIIGQQLKIRTI